MDPASSFRPRDSLGIALDARYMREKPSGIGAYVQALVERLPALSPEDHFFFWAHPLGPKPLSAAPNASSQVVRAGPNSPLPVLWPQRQASFAGVDVFHCPHNMMSRALPCSSVVTVHDVMAIDAPRLHLQGAERLVKSLYYRQAVWRALREATQLIAQSQATADRICDLVPGAAKRIRVIWSAPDRDLIPAPERAVVEKKAASLTNGDSPFLLLVGANTASKRHDLALAAFARAVPEPWRLVLIQRRKASRALARLAKQLDIEDRVVWLEAIAREDLVTLLQAADGLVQPSVYEGFGLPVLEAMACGCPVVASDIAPIREVTAGTALLFQAGDVTALANALGQFVRSQPLRRSLGEQGLARSRDFSWDDCAEATLEVYHQAAGR